MPKTIDKYQKLWYNKYRKLRKEVIIMKNIFKKINKMTSTEMIVCYKWNDTDEIEMQKTNSCGLASLESDPCITVIKVMAL